MAESAFMKGMIEGLSEEDVESLKGRMMKRVKERFPGGEIPGSALVATARV